MTPVRRPSHRPSHVLIALLLAAGCASHGSSKVAPATTAAAPVRPAEHVAAGNDLMSRNLLDDAEREYRIALEGDPNDRGALAGLGQVNVLRGQYKEALPSLQRATQISTQMVGAFRSLGDAYTAMGDAQRASTAYRQAVALAPQDLRTRGALAQSLVAIGETGEAREICAATVRMTKGNPADQARAYQQLGEVCAAETKIPESMSALYRASELLPGDPEIARSLAETAVRGGLYAEAATAYTRVLTLAPLDVDAKKQLAFVNFKLERYPVAIKNYESVQESLGTADRYYLAQAYAKSNKVDRAVDLFREVAKADPQNYKGVYCNMAYAYYDASRYQRAIEVVREGLAGDSASACLRFCWAQALDKLGRHEDAIPVFEAVLNDPAYAEPAKRELERQRRIVRLLKSKDRAD
ncbi:MAG TPA: tetratricopeptide repeat protein [Candidatus Eisenbacteria bacterium]|jgi:tetratricopeptide (TPR) repeat protein|nr:tetratricopeptide repeat protein [Candidatus Eisenbacteria bacterium]